MNYLLSKFLPLGIIYLTVLVIFFPGLFNFFLQDDFFNLYRGWLGYFTPSPYLAFRFLPYEIFGSFVVYILGINPVLTHLFLLLTHLFNIYLLFELIGKFTKNKKIQFIISFLYGTSSIHFGVLFWMTANYILLGTTFLLLFLHALYYNITNITKSKLLLLLFLYLCMLLTSEAFSLFPIFLFVVSLHARKIRPLLLPATFLSGMSIVFRFAAQAYSTGPDYALSSISEIARTVWWYILRGLNLAEGIRLMEKIQLQFVFLNLLILAFCMGIALFVFVKIKQKPDRKILGLGLIWFIVFGTVYFLLVHHITAYYLNTALVGFILIITYFWLPIFGKKENRYKFLTIIFLISYSLLSYINIRFAQQTSWIVVRGETARKYIQLAKKLYPTLPKGATLVFGKTNTDYQEISLSLYGEYAFKLIYNDPTLKVIYDKMHILRLNEYGISETDT